MISIIIFTGQILVVFYEISTCGYLKWHHFTVPNGVNKYIYQLKIEN